MSMQALLDQIAAIGREIHAIEGQITTINSNISRKRRELATIGEKFKN